MGQFSGTVRFGESKINVQVPMAEEWAATFPEKEMS